MAGGRPQYWVVGAMWGGHDDQFEDFIQEGYWRLGWADEDQPVQARRRGAIEPGDRIAIKKNTPRFQGIEIRSIGVVTGIDPKDHRVYVRWVASDLHHRVPSRGCYASIHGPFSADDEWTQRAFQLEHLEHSLSRGEIPEQVTPLSEIGTSVEPPPDRVQSTTTRIVRDTAEARRLKKLYKYRCQICRKRIELGFGECYAEVHHIRPLGGRHQGLDTQENMLVVCPTHHAMFDLGWWRFPRNQL